MSSSLPDFSTIGTDIKTRLTNLEEGLQEHKDEIIAALSELIVSYGGTIPSSNEISLVDNISELNNNSVDPWDEFN